jgi:transposase-like protein
MVTVRTRSITPDLFSQDGEDIQPSANLPLSRTGVTASFLRHVLPNDLPKAVKQLENRELDELLSVVLAEQKRRKLPTVDKSARKRQVEAVPLTPGKLNAVRAAFSAGITPARIGREFGLSQSQVRKALASR